MMIVVIIAGGSGTRLWPLSTHDYPKHLLKLTNERSLLQNTYDRISPLAKNEDIFIVPEVSHVDHVYQQVPEIPKQNILHEPGRRGTASCFALVLAEIKKREYKDQAIFFLWADGLIRDKRGFSATVNQAAKLAEEKEQLVFIGVEPNYPSTGFGYMHTGERSGSAFELKGFVEKPDKQKAEEYFESGDYLWNTGYLAGTLKTFERELKEVAPKLWENYQSLITTKNVEETYLGFEPDAIDYALSEHVKDGLVVPGNFDWADIGSFNDLHSLSHQGDDGNHTRGENIELENVTNSYIRNEQALPVAVIGLDNIAVVATKNGILVTNKNYSQKVGDLAKRLQAKDPS